MVLDGQFEKFCFERWPLENTSVKKLEEFFKMHWMRVLNNDFHGAGTVFSFTGVDGSQNGTSGRQDGRVQFEGGTGPLNFLS